VFANENTNRAKHEFALIDAYFYYVILFPLGCKFGWAYSKFFEGSRLIFKHDYRYLEEQS